MNLDAYLKTPNAKSLTALALELGVSKGRLSQLRHKSEWPADLALKLEGATGGAVDAGWLSLTIAKAREAA